jgi:hypothetical protein
MAEETVVIKSLDILDQMREIIENFKSEHNKDPKQIELGSAAYRRFAVTAVSVQPKINFENVAVSLNWEIDAEEIRISG